MKLRQHIFNSLPRLKSKHKEKQVEQKHTKTQPALPNPHSEIIEEVTGDTCQKPAESVKRERPARPLALPIKNSDYKGNAGAISRITPRLDNNPRNGMKSDGVIDSGDPNLNTESTKCACFKHCDTLGGSSSPEEDSYKQNLPTSNSPSLSPSTSSAEDSGFISLPKTRTRIKTNPWLPSPRSSPGTSPDISPISSSTSSPVYSDRENFSPFAKPIGEASHQAKPKKRRKYKTGNEKMTTSLNIPVTQPAKYALLNNCKTTEESNSLLQGSLLSESDNCGTENGLKSLDNSISVGSDTSSVGNYVAHCVDIGSGKTSCTELDEQDVDQVMRGDFIDSHVSFQYEEAFESQLEVKGVGEYVESRDELSDDTYDHHFNNPLGSRAHDFDSEYCPSGYDSSPVTDYNSETETDDTVCDDYYTATGFRGHGRPGPFNDLFREYYHSDGDSEQDSDDEEEDYVIEALSESRMSPRKRMLKRERDFRSRGAEHLRHNLQQQLENLCKSQEVGRIQKEQMLVDQHLLEAQEVERLRLEERRRLKKEVNMHRKRLLLRTLQELRSKLEDQSWRLQQTYSAVLYLQQAIICDRRQHPPPPTHTDIREAPF